MITMKSQGGLVERHNATTIETYPAANTIKAGQAVMLNAQGQVEVATNGNVIGFAVLSNTSTVYSKGEPVAVLTNGTITTEVKGAVAINDRLNYHGTDLKLLKTGGNATAFLTVIAKEATASDAIISVYVSTTK